MTVHLFGASSSPSCSNFALRRAADDYEEECGSPAANFVLNDFYVDDGLKSVKTPEEAVSLIKSTQELCSKGGFTLHKIVSNSSNVLQKISPENKSQSSKDLDLTQDEIPIERALGVNWCIESDTLRFRIQLKDQPLTRRGLLSTVSSIFDPLGLVSPFVLIGKRILQQLCQEGQDWDQRIPDYIRPTWQKWRTEILLLSELQVPRCYKPPDFGEPEVIEVHHFSDASTNGYGQCSYLRLINKDNEVHCSLILSKSRVSPLKLVTIPRLELTAAVVSVKISQILSKEPQYTRPVAEYFYTDSQVVLGYIRNEARRFHTFVANRVQKIRDHTSPDQWRYVESKSNPADDASRGLWAAELIKNTRWWNGPEFLWKRQESTQESNQQFDISQEDPEFKSVSTMKTQVNLYLSILERLTYFSSWYKAARAIALCLRLLTIHQESKQDTQELNQETQIQEIRKTDNKDEEETKRTEDNQETLRTKEQENQVTQRTQTKNKKQENLPKNKRTRDKPYLYVLVNAEEIENAETRIIMMLQKQYFDNEIKTLTSNEEQETKDSKLSKSPLYRLDPFLDEKGILRVGGRIKHAKVPDVAKHPIIIPKKGHITDLIICHHHNRIQYQGRGITHQEIRSTGYWIIDGSSCVSYHISKCVKCRKLRGITQSQKMADLPEDRLEPSPPFTYCSVDFFGPFVVKERRTELKRYGALFTCNVSRAIHLEIANDMSADSFINAHRRFVGRRGPIRQLRTDQGSNFVGARTELKTVQQEMNQEKIRQELLKDGCDWYEIKMNVPYSSHMGGVWERQIRTVRSILSALMDQHSSHLDDECLRTFMVEAESIVNNRPLTTISTDPDQPITPNHILTSKTKILLPPPGVFMHNDVYLRKRWRKVQYIANEFWNSWRKSYLQNLQERQKWSRSPKNLQVNDIVIIKSYNEPRNHWRLARVDEVYPEDDGLVRKVKLQIADLSLDRYGKRVKPVQYLERPVHKLVLLLSADETEDQGNPHRGALI